MEILDEEDLENYKDKNYKNITKEKFSLSIKEKNKIFKWLYRRRKFEKARYNFFSWYFYL